MSDREPLRIPYWWVDDHVDGHYRRFQQYYKPGEFVDLGARISNALILNEFWTRSMVAATDDAELLACRNIGFSSLSVIRAAIPRTTSSAYNLDQRC
jgi:hypothetical protein